MVGVIFPDRGIDAQSTSAARDRQERFFGYLPIYGGHLRRMLPDALLCQATTCCGMRLCGVREWRSRFADSDTPDLRGFCRSVEGSRQLASPWAV